MQEERNESGYAEWVLPKWSSFLPILIIYPTIWLTMLPINETAGVWIGLGLTVLTPILMLLKAPRINVSDGQLKVGNAVIDRKYISAASPIEEADSFAARGRDLDSRAFIYFQGSVKSLLRVEINDPMDPTPYWLFSTRHAAEIARKLGF